MALFFFLQQEKKHTKFRIAKKENLKLLITILTGST
jgi:hypothetical protein